MDESSEHILEGLAAGFVIGILAVMVGSARKSGEPPKPTKGMLERRLQELVNKERYEAAAKMRGLIDELYPPADGKENV